MHARRGDFKTSEANSSELFERFGHAMRAGGERWTAGEYALIPLTPFCFLPLAGGLGRG